MVPSIYGENMFDDFFDNSFFGFTKVTVETAQADAKGKPVLKKGKKQPVKGASDTEIIPLSEDRDTYMKKNVLPCLWQRIRRRRIHLYMG